MKRAPNSNSELKCDMKQRNKWRWDSALGGVVTLGTHVMNEMTVEKESSNQTLIK